MDFLALFAGIPLAAIILFGIGVVLLIIELCVPGFGVAGVSSLIAFALAILFAADTFLEGLIFTGIVLLVIAIVAVVFLVLLSKGRLSANFILKAKNSNEEGFSSAAADLAFLVGREGTAQTALRPSGRAMIDGKVYDVVSSGDYISSGDPIRVIDVNGNRIVVAEPAMENV